MSDNEYSDEPPRPYECPFIFGMACYVCGIVYASVIFFTHYSIWDNSSTDNFTKVGFTCAVIIVYFILAFFFCLFVWLYKRYLRRLRYIHERQLLTEDMIIHE